VPLAAAAILAAVAGCTMCPDPHDYSGPVPNGSAPQNDFRVRSNGILPIGATPPPWPTVVKAGAARPQAEPADAAGVADAEPLVADAEPLVADAEPLVADAEPLVADAETLVADAEPLVADAEPLVADAETPAPDSDIDSDVVRLSAEEEPGQGFVVDAGVDRHSVETEDLAPDAAGGDASVAVETEAGPAAGDDRPVSVPASALRETPGWRSRR
jgi:hypothetical protein